MLVAIHAKMPRLDLSSHVGIGSTEYDFGGEPEMSLLISSVIIILNDWSVLGGTLSSKGNTLLLWRVWNKSSSFDSNLSRYYRFF